MVKKVIFHDRAPSSYRNLSYDKKEDSYYKHERHGGPGSPNPKPNRISKDEAADMSIHGHPAYKREIVDKIRHELLSEHQLPHWKEK